MSSQGYVKLAVISVVAVSTLLCFQNCGRSGFQAKSYGSEGTGKGQLDSFGGGTTTDNPKPTVNVVLNQYSAGGVQAANICAKSMSFSANNAPSVTSIASTTTASTSGSGNGNGTGNVGSGNGNFNGNGAGFDPSQFQFFDSYFAALANLALNPMGTFVNQLVLPSGTYQAIDLVLDPSCGSSLAINNNFGSVVSTEPLTLHFIGNLTLAPGDTTLPLNIQPILLALAGAQTPADIKAIVAATQGTF